MKQHLTTFFAPFLFAFLYFNADDFSTKLSKKLVDYQTAAPQEKAYLQTDKPYYSVGDTIWLKTFLVVANQLLPDTVSKTIYVELIDEKTGKTALWHRYPLKNGMANGSMVLNDSTLGGSYVLRAYNNFMRNFSNELIFSKKIKIFNEETVASKIDTTTYDVQFFPEGGSIISGLNNKIAFKAVNSLGKGINVEGFILSSTSDTLSAFSTTHFGMGFFNLTPDPQKSYKAIIKQGQGKWQQYNLPAVLNEGIALQIDNLSNKNNVRVIISQNLRVKETDVATLVVYGQGEIRLAANIPLNKKVSLINIPRTTLGEGISYITIFDNKQRPVCERLVWANKVVPLKVKFKTDKNTYRPKEKVELELTVTDANNQPVAANFMLSATDQNQVSGQNAHNLNLLSYLHLTSDLKGAVENPSYYFDTTQVQAAFHLDYLMLTQGWRRFKWQDILADSVPQTKYLIEQGITVSGNITKLNGKSPGKVNMTVMVKEEAAPETMFKDETDENGRFDFSDLEFRDSTQFYISAATPKDNRDLLIKLDGFIPPKFYKSELYDESNGIEAKSLNAYLQLMAEYRTIEEKIRKSGEKQLGEVVVKAQRLQVKDTRKTYSVASRTLKGEELNLTGSQNPIEALQGRIPGVQVSGQGANLVVSIRAASNLAGAVEPLYLLDGLTVDLQTLINTPIKLVESIDILKQSEASLFGSRGSGGVIAVYTKRGNPNFDPKTEKSPGTFLTKLFGYQPIREFYSPKYESNDSKSKPDFRSTVYWNPNIQTDKTGKATISFFNTDAVTTVYLNLEGISQQGQIGVSSNQYTVK